MTGTTTSDNGAPRAAQRGAVAAGAAGPLASGAPGPGKPATIPLTPEIQNRIGSQLQSLYNDLLAEATPDRFLKLLDDLDRKS